MLLQPGCQMAAGFGTQAHNNINGEPELAELRPSRHVSSPGKADEGKQTRHAEHGEAERANRRQGVLRAAGGIGAGTDRRKLEDACFDQVQPFPTTYQQAQKLWKPAAGTNGSGVHVRLGFRTWCPDSCSALLAGVAIGPPRRGRRTGQATAKRHGLGGGARATTPPRATDCWRWRRGWLAGGV